MHSNAVTRGACLEFGVTQRGDRVLQLSSVARVRESAGGSSAVHLHRFTLPVAVENSNECFSARYEQSRWLCEVWTIE
jgi:hypothetical protein